MNKAFKYPKNSMELAREMVNSRHPDANLFVDNPEWSRFELSIPSVNRVLSGQYFGPRSGFVLGKLYNFHGAESSGKSALAYQIMADIYKEGGSNLLIDVERSAEFSYIKGFGLDMYDTKRNDYIKPDYAEQGFDAAIVYAQSRAVSCILVDSVSALGTERTINNDAEKNDVGHAALRVSQHLQRAIKASSDNECAIIYVNQERINLISMGAIVKAAGKKFTGGEAMKFYPHTAMLFKKSNVLQTSNGEFVAQGVDISTIKNKLGPPFLSATIYLIPGEGFSRELDILFLGLEKKICIQKGAYYYFGEETIGQGLLKCLHKLKERPDMTEAIWQKFKYTIEPHDVNIETGEVIEEALVESEEVVETTESEETEEITEKPKRGRKKK
jgi:recombination protein RecA